MCWNEAFWLSLHVTVRIALHQIFTSLVNSHLHGVDCLLIKPIILLLHVLCILCVCVCHSAHLNSLRNKSCDKIQMPNITRQSKQFFLLCKMRSSTLWLFIYFYAFVFICNSICIDLLTFLSLLSHFLLQTIEINIQAICYKQCYIH